MTTPLASFEPARSSLSRLAVVLALLAAILVPLARAHAAEPAPTSESAEPEAEQEAEPEPRLTVGVDGSLGAAFPFAYPYPALSSELSLHIGGLLDKVAERHAGRHVSLGVLLQGSYKRYFPGPGGSGLHLGSARALFVATGLGPRRGHFFWQAGLGPLAYFGGSFSLPRFGVGVAARLGYTPQAGATRRSRFLVGVGLNTDVYASVGPVVMNTVSAFVGWALL